MTEIEKRNLDLACSELQETILDLHARIARIQADLEAEKPKEQDQAGGVKRRGSSPWFETKKIKRVESSDELSGESDMDLS